MSILAMTESEVQLVTEPQAYARRYEALLRATNAIGSCDDRSRTGEVLREALADVVSYDYLDLIVFDEETATVRWHLRHANSWMKDLAGDPLENSPGVWAYEYQQFVVISDWNRETRFPRHREFLHELRIASTCTLPLMRGKRRLGALTFGSTQADSYPEQEVRFLSLVADQVALAVDAAVNFNASQQTRNRLQLVLDLTNQVVSNLDFQDLLRSISIGVRQVMHADAAAIMLPDSEGKNLRVHALDFPESRGFFVRESLIPIAGTMPGTTFTSSRPSVVNRLDPAELAPEMYAKASGEGLNSLCNVALISRDRPLGVLAVAKREGNAFQQAEIAFLSQVARQVAIGVENALAYGEIAALKDKLAQEKLYLEDEIRGEMDFEGIVGQSSALRHVLNLVETVAPSDSTVLLLGETGTGKELIARAIHDRSRRKDRTFVKLNCAAIPTGLLESELFGHERGAFTGAISQKVGRLELADKGSLFLDEVGDIPIEVQPKLLRALQEREFERLGSTHTKKVDVRLVAATNRDLEKMIENREFRSDLYYRLNVFPIRIPPLRERPEDIPLLVRYFAQKYGRRMEKQVESIPAAAMKQLSSWHWPGNIRELENFVERSIILTRGPALQVPVSELGSSGAAAIEGAREAGERGEILRILKETKGRVAGSDGAAALLGLKRTTLISRMKRLGIDPRKVS
jgi:formate hydrogenlyase transcriptional activator